MFGRISQVGVSRNNTSWRLPDCPFLPQVRHPAEWTGTDLNLWMSVESSYHGFLLFAFFLFSFSFPFSFFFNVYRNVSWKLRLSSLFLVEKKKKETKCSSGVSSLEAAHISSNMHLATAACTACLCRKQNVHSDTASTPGPEQWVCKWENTSRSKQLCGALIIKYHYVQIVLSISFPSKLQVETLVFNYTSIKTFSFR